MTGPASGTSSGTPAGPDQAPRVALAPKPVAAARYDTSPMAEPVARRILSRPVPAATAATPAPPKYPVIDAIRRNAPIDATTHESVALESPLVRTRGFSLWYGKNQALHSVTLDAPLQRVTALIGPSGCGKSTLLRSVNRLNDLIDGVRTQGNLFVADEDVYDGADLIDLRLRVGMVFQKPNPFPMSIFDNVAYPLRIHGERSKAVLREACEKCLRAAALWDEVKDRLDQPATGLSGGQQQRLCIARAVVAEPEVLLLDEPCSALDPAATLRIEELILELGRRYTVLIVTHNMQQAARVSDFTAFMYLGRLVEYGRTGDIFQAPRLRETEDYVTGRFG